jgi:type IX secretion system PorP/SprF family membrane protein
MKKPTYIKLFTLACLALPIIGFSQDIHFSQIYETPLLRNPALAGLFSGDVRVQSVYRTQWNSVTVPYQTTSFNGEFKIPVGQYNDFLTIGGQALYDKAGTTAMSTTHLLPTINYHKALSEEKNMYLSMGFMGGYVQRSIDRSKVTTNNQFDGMSYNPGLSDGENFNRTAYGYFDGSAGISFNSQLRENEKDNFYLGLAYHHFNKAKNISFYSDANLEMQPKWVGSAGIRFSMTEYSYFTVEGDFTTQGSYKEVITGALYSLKLDDPEMPKYSLHFGSYIRWGDAVIPVAKLECSPLTVSASYDANVSALTPASRGAGGFEIAISYKKFLNNDNSSKDKVRCPKF